MDSASLEGSLSVSEQTALLETILLVFKTNAVTGKDKMRENSYILDSAIVSMLAEPILFTMLVKKQHSTMLW